MVMCSNSFQFYSSPLVGKIYEGSLEYNKSEYNQLQIEGVDMHCYLF